jgi:hypothetical protein
MKGDLNFPLSFLVAELLVSILVCIFDVLFGGEREEVGNQSVSPHFTDCLTTLYRLLDHTLPTA